MVYGFGFVSIVPTKEHEVFNKMLEVPGIEELYLLFEGGYNLMAKINAEDFNKIGDIVVNKIMTMDGVVGIRVLTEDVRF